MRIQTPVLNSIFQASIALGILLALINFFNVRSLWLDEAMLALNIVNKPIPALLAPLDYHQVAPIGFLLLEKFFSSLFGNTDWSLRIVPMLSFFGSISVFYALSFTIRREQCFALFATAWYSLSFLPISYSSEAKPYMSDVLISLSIVLATLLFIEKNNKKSLGLYALIGVLAVWFSHISVILLFTAGLYVLYKTLKGDVTYGNALVVLGSWSLSFALYYVVFIHNHPTKAYMVHYWEDFGAFLPHPIFSMDFCIALYHKIEVLFSLLGVRLWSLAALPVFAAGLLFLYKMKREMVYLFVFPILLHLLLAYFKMYPIHHRLILYLLPTLIIGIATGIYTLLTFLAPKCQRVYSYLLVLPLVFNLVVVHVRGFPIEKEAIKKALAYVNAKKAPEDMLYVYYGASSAFSFYKSDFPRILNTDDTHMIIGKPHRAHWTEYETAIRKIDRPVWILFSHIYVKKNAEGLDEEAYIIRAFRAHGFQIVDAQQYQGASIYKAVPVTQVAQHF